MSFKTYRNEGIILKSAIIREADLLLTIYTPHSGKIRAVARGARKSSSKFVGHLELLNRVDISVATGKNLDLVTQVQSIQNFSSMRANLEALSKGLYLSELIDGFSVDGSGNPELYNLFCRMLAILEDHHQIEIQLRYFEFHLLRLSGFMPELHTCCECHKQLEPKRHLFSPAKGGTLCDKCDRSGSAIFHLSLTTLKVLRFIKKTTLDDITKVTTPKPVLMEIHALLSNSIKYWLEKELKTTAFMDRLEKEWPSNPITA